MYLIQKYVRAFLIGGRPNSGKTKWTDVYQRHNPNVLRFCLDTFFRDPEYQQSVGFVDDIARHCRSKRFNKEVFLAVAKQKLNAIHETSGIVDVVVEGFVVRLLAKELEQLLKEAGCNDVITLNFNGFSFDYFGTKVNFAAPDTIDYTGKATKNPEAACLASFQKLRQIDFDRLKKGINYQSFPEFGHKGTSNSPGKLTGVLAAGNESFLDIGCNNGYFCFEAAKTTTGRILGIDREAPIAIAEKLNHNVFRNQNIEFLVKDAFDLAPDERFDHIFCASVFHYFKDRQEEFLALLPGLMNHDSIAAIEIETGPHNPRPLRFSGRRQLAYPNRVWIEQKTANTLKLVDLKRSVDQRGADYPRFFYFFKRR